MNVNEKTDADYLLNRVIEILSPHNRVVDDQIEFIVAALMILLEHPLARGQYTLFLSPDLTTKIEGKLHDKICAVINNTYLMKGEQATLHDDLALEAIRDYLLESDEFIFYKNEKRIVRKPKPLKRNTKKRRGKYD